jgi:hypothetical protein
MEKEFCTIENGKEHETDILLSENQSVGTGDGYGHYRDLYQRADGTRYSVRRSEPKWIESNSRVKK